MKKICVRFKRAGESYLCDTCKMYPRRVEEYEGLREYSLSLSCPKADRNDTGKSKESNIFRVGDRRRGRI